MCAVWPPAGHTTHLCPHFLMAASGIVIIPPSTAVRATHGVCGGPPPTLPPEMWLKK